MTGSWRPSLRAIHSREDLEAALRELYGVEASELRIGPEAEATIWCLEKRGEGRLDSEDHLL